MIKIDSIFAGRISAKSRKEVMEDFREKKDDGRQQSMFRSMERRRW